MSFKGLLLLLAEMLAVLSVAEAGAYIKNREKIKTVWEMGAGINLGNSLDVIGLRERHPEAGVEEYEVYWGNPPITRQAVKSIAQRGFGTIRIPVSWGEHLDEENRIDPTFMARVTEITDWALEENLYVILDMHHEKWLIPTPEQEEMVTKKLSFVWQQIAVNFREYGDHLLFEGMNEPRLEGSETEWTGGTPELQQVVNRLNTVFVETVRNSGGENANRWLLIPAYGTSYETEALEALEVPKDDRIIVAVHAYVPYSFTLADEGSKKWDADHSEDTEQLDGIMNDLERLFLRKGIPVMITEFGCHEKEDETERMEWAVYYKKAADEKGIPCIWWDNGRDSKLVDRQSGEWQHEELVDILIEAGK